MIYVIFETEKTHGESFRLLNSEIGNDPIKYQNGIRMGVTSIK